MTGTTTTTVAADRWARAVACQARLNALTPEGHALAQRLYEDAWQGCPRVPWEELSGDQTQPWLLRAASMVAEGGPA